MPFSQDIRAQLLTEAEADVRRWCCPKDQRVDGRRLPDTHWLSLFAGDVTKEDAHRFLITFLLTNRVAWQTEGVAQAIMDVRAMQAFDPLEEIPTLAMNLPTGGPTRQHSSAASKIATFARPEADVFIWDRLASKAARYRDWLRGVRPRPRRPPCPSRLTCAPDYPGLS